MSRKEGGRSRTQASLPAPRARVRAEAPAPPLPVAFLALIGVLVALLALAPPENNYVWAVNGFRSIALEPRVLLVAIAAIAAFLASIRGRNAFFAIALIVAVVVAFPLREKIHLLGDTQVRVRSIVAFSEQVVGEGLREWSHRLHANPLDIGVDFLLPAALTRVGLGALDAISAVCALLAAAFFAGLWRISGRLGVAPAVRVGFTLALGIAGTLQVFAGYSESTGLLLAAAAWWWAAMLAPLDRRRPAWELAIAWLVLLLSHRMALVLVLPLAVRLFGPPAEGDRPDERRVAAGLCAGALAIAGVAMLAGAGAGQLASDWRDLFGGAGAGHLPRLLSPVDWLNTMLLVAPLALPALLIATAAGGALRRAEVWTLVAALAPLLPIGLMLPVADSGLGAQRDFDLNALFGLTLTIGAGLAMARVPAARLAGALRLLLPVLVLGAAGFVLANADEAVAVRRALAMASKPPALAPTHDGTLHVFLGQRAMDTGHPEMAGAYYDRAFEVGGNPRRAILAAEAWGMAGNPTAARRSLAAARSRGPLSPALASAAATIESTLVQREVATGDTLSGAH